MENSGRTVRGTPWIVRGEKVGLVSTRKEDFVERWMRYGNDPIIMMRLAAPVPPVTRTQLEQDWEKVEGGNGRLFDVVTVDDERLVGEGQLTGISWPNASARIGMVIFEDVDRGRGYGTEAVRLLANYGFDAIGLHSLSIEFLSDNAGLQRLGEAFGGTTVGVLREHYFAFGRHRDVTIVQALRSDLEPHPATAPLREM